MRLIIIAAEHRILAAGRARALARRFVMVALLA